MAAVCKKGKWGFIDVKSFEYINKRGEVINPSKLPKNNTKNSYLDLVILEEDNKIDPNTINYNKMVTEEKYISSTKEIPKDYLSVEILSYRSTITLYNGDELQIEASSLEELKEKTEKVYSSQLNILNNTAKNTSIIRKRTKKINSNERNTRNI